MQNFKLVSRYNQVFTRISIFQKGCTTPTGSVLRFTEDEKGNFLIYKLPTYVNTVRIIPYKIVEMCYLNFQVLSFDKYYLISSWKILQVS